MPEREGIIVSSYKPEELRFCLSGNDALTLLEFIHKSFNCNTKEDYLALFPKIRELLPFDFANSFLAHHDTDKGLVLLYNANISFPKEWLNEYMSGNYLQNDVTVVENFATYKVQHWDEERLRIYRQNEALISLYKDYTMTGCYTHGARLVVTGKNGSMFCFAGSSVKFDRRTEAILEFVTPHLHLALTHLYNNKQLELNMAIISQREKEVLNWLKEGKSSWDISVILGISERTINYHIYHIMAKLGVTNRPQAVAVAARLGLVEFG